MNKHKQILCIASLLLCFQLSMAQESRRQYTDLLLGARLSGIAAPKDVPLSYGMTFGALKEKAGFVVSLSYGKYDGTPTEGEIDQTPVVRVLGMSVQPLVKLMNGIYVGFGPKVNISSVSWGMSGVVSLRYQYFEQLFVCVGYSSYDRMNVGVDFVL
jgi:hypothetical protein